MWFNGFLDLSPWQLVAVTLVLTHITIVSVTVYLHRYSAHRALDLHPALQHFFRFWLWLTTGMNTREWTAIHRKHHAKCETVEDPHSPVHKGLFTVLRAGAELYKAEAKNQDTLRIYGKNCPDDWIDLGWAWIKLFSFLRLVRVARVAPIAHRVEGKHSLDMDTAMAILNNRFQIMAQYRKLVIAPLVKQEVAKADESVRHLFRRAKRLLSRETSLLQDRHHVRIDSMLAHSQALKVIYEKRLALQQIWAKTSANGHDMLAAIKDWVHEAEASGIQSLKEFAAQLKTYSLRPA